MDLKIQQNSEYNRKYAHIDIENKLAVTNGVREGSGSLKG